MLNDPYAPESLTYRNLLEIPLLFATAAPDRPLLTDVGGSEWSRAETIAEVSGVQAWLASLNIAPGQRVALFCANSARMIAGYLAVIGMGAEVVPINTALRGDVLTYILDHSRVVAAIADADLVGRLLGTKPGRLSLDRVLLTADRSELTPWPQRRPPGDLVIAEPLNTAQIIYTSGTTSRPKGVMLGAQAILTSASACARLIHNAQEDSVLYTSMPLFHCGAQQVSLWSTLLSGAHLIVARRFSASTFWQQLDDYEVDHFNFIGQMLSILCTAAPSPADREHRVSVAVGGGPKNVWTEFEQRFAVQIREMYGMSETFSGCVSHTYADGKVNTVGRPLPHIELRIVDQRGRVQQPGQDGEIQLRPRSRDLFFTRYLDDPEADQQAWDGEWFRTGDLGQVDREGYLIYRERLTGTIRHKGENISAAAVELELGKLLGVREVAAVAVPSHLGEDDLLVALVAEPGVTAKDVMDYCAAHLPSYALPEYVVFLKELPKTETMRVQKHLLQERFKAGVLGGRGSSLTPVASDPEA
jgi:crotonobetaine/carnitine-CoA ligase